MRNIVNLQLKPNVTKALQHNIVQAQEPVSTRKGTKRVIEILDMNYDKANSRDSEGQLFSPRAITTREAALIAA